MDTCLTETLVAHSLAYSFLSKAFYDAPDAEFIRMLADERLFDDWPLVNDDDSTRIGLELLQGFCAGWHDGQLASLKEDYAALFIGPDALLAPPWESVYRSVDHLIFEKQTLEVRAEYQQFGMEIPKLNVEPDDHLGLELRFIAHLANVGLNALSENQLNVLALVQDEIGVFYAEHLSQWSDECLSRIVQHAQTDYYRGVAFLTRGSLAHTATVFSKVAQEIRS